MHLHPALERTLPELLGDHGFRFTRLIYDVDAPLLGPLFAWMSNQLRRHLQRKKIGYPRRTFALGNVGHSDTQVFLKALAKVRPGQPTEFYYHPGMEVSAPDPHTVLKEAQRLGIQLISCKALLE
jgi:hypothetical protein